MYKISKRLEQIIQILEYSQEVTLKIPTIIIEGETLENNKFQHIKHALKKLQDNETLTVTITEENEYSLINIQIQPTNTL